MPPRKIGLLGHYSGRNLGDECVVAALIQNIRKRCPLAEIVGISLDPEDTTRRYGIPAYPLRRSSERRGGSTRAGRADVPHPILERLRATLKRVPFLRALVRGGRAGARAAAAAIREIGFLRRAYRNLAGVDLLIVAGSGPLSDDWAGPWSHPYTIFKWAMLARLRGTRFVPLCVGAGPVDHALTRFFLRWILRWSSYRSFRDPSSAAVIGALGVSGDNPVFPDLAFSLDLPVVSPNGHLAGLPRGRGVVGLSPLPHYDGRHVPDGDQDRYERYLRKVADFAAWLLQGGYTVVLLSSQVTGDPRVCADLRRLLGERADLGTAERLIEPPIRTLEDLVAAISVCDYVVAARFHCIILPYLLGKPVVALAYHPKTPDLMAYMGQSEFWLDIDDFEPRELAERFIGLVSRAEAVKAEVARRIPLHRRALEAQYDRLLGTIGG